MYKLIGDTNEVSEFPALNDEKNFFTGPARRYYKNEEGFAIPITFEIQDSVSQRILSNVMRIYLDEILGYDSNLVYENSETSDVLSTLTRIES